MQTPYCLLFPTSSLRIMAVLALLSGCTYDNEEELFGPDEPATCDTATVTYAGTIRPLLQQHCYSCHSGAAPEAGVNLADYNTAKVYANIGSLMGVVTHAAGYAAMPKNQPKLSDCDINRLRAWVDAGAPNN